MKIEKKNYFWVALFFRKGRIEIFLYLIATVKKLNVKTVVDF